LGSCHREVIIGKLSLGNRHWEIVIGELSLGNYHWGIIIGKLSLGAGYLSTMGVINCVKITGGIIDSGERSASSVVLTLRWEGYGLR
jgi:hypothetical protein